jgi:hypothetical protein
MKTFGFLQAESLNFSQAIRSEESFECKISIIQILDDLEQLNAYKVVEKPKGVNIVGSRWVCKKKYDGEGNLLKFKKSWLTPWGYPSMGSIIKKPLHHLL